ncbi:MAG: metabolite traffic protein EboE [Planctomycetia bacterium]|nr:metabolite traffic protein EboE [Planctomycetia bacterium]
MKPILGYCTNVHAGADWTTTQANLARYAVAVRERVSPQEAMGVGLWLSNSAAESLGNPAAAESFRVWLASHGLRPFTVNGFPYGDFHQPVVKHRVYEPNWFDRRRVEYTKQLATLLAALLPSGQGGSISTLPLCWGTPAPTAIQLDLAAAHVREVGEHLHALRETTGHEIVLSIEPEPGCAIQRVGDVLSFFHEQLWQRKTPAETLRRHIGVCHDVCHSVVMYEEQADVLEQYHRAGIRVGKVQVSSAVTVDFARLAPDERRQAIEQLHGFDERRYLHQTNIRQANGEVRFYEDLSQPLAEVGDAVALTSEWRIHFHVPVYVQRFGQLQASQPAIVDALGALRRFHPDVTDYEVETYAWGVLPAELQQPNLAAGIAEEMRWCAAAMRTA